MKAIVHPGMISGSLRVPASKSYMQRALALALLHKGETVLSNAGGGKDVENVLRIIQSLGAFVEGLPDGKILIRGTQSLLPDALLDCGESALAARLFSMVGALSEGRITVTGNGSLLKRPMRELETIFSQLDVYSKTSDGFLPATIKGPIKAVDISIDASSGSQYLTGLLIALAATAAEPLKISVRNLVSKPYIELTMELLEAFGYSIEQYNYSEFTIFPNDRQKTKIELVAEADWSNASFWLVAGAIAGDISLDNLNVSSAQGDKTILNVLKEAGVTVNRDGVAIAVKKADSILPINFDAIDFPDLFPPLAILAACANGTSVISGVSRLHNKESDRAFSILQLLTNLGIEAHIKDDDLVVIGGKISGGQVDSFNDHRIAMAAAIAALRASDIVTINNADAVEKSYPDFFEHLKSLGAFVSLQPETN